MAAAPLRPPELGGTADVKDTAKPGETDPSDTLAVLQALAYEGDPSEIAEGFREQGNAGFKQRKFRDAIGFYTRALDEVGKDLSIEERRALWGNRAAANLELGNYGACLRDCSQILGQTNSSYPDLPSDASNRLTMKALFRSARALSALGKLPESLDALKRLGTLGVELGEQDKDAGKGVRIEVERKQAEKERKEAEKAERERRKREGDAAIAVALTHRGVVFPKPTSKTPLFANCPTDVTPPHFDAYIPADKSEIPLNIDIVSDIRRLNDLSIKSKKAGMIILGGGRNGADFSVYINAGQEFDGSDSGARPDETVSWGKIRIDGESVKVYADATLVFPLRVAGT
ncbi:HSP70/90 co-chaperone [Rhodotorula sphaerocarpa]